MKMMVVFSGMTIFRLEDDWFNTVDGHFKG
jgi:hypothetical protein